MPPEPARSPARLLAPAALVTLALAVIVIVLTSGGGDDTTPQPTDTAAGEETAPTRRAATGRRRARTYTVRPRDTLGSISVKTGIEVESLQELNPQVDPQALIAGQKIKLRE